MIIDTSAVVAILFRESEAAKFIRAVEIGPLRLMSAASLVEASMVIESRKGEAGAREIDLFLYRAQIEIVAVDQDQAEIARAAWRRYGKGRHAASLHYGDCFAYALAKSRRLPLPFQGHDFSRTDIEVVPLPTD